MSADLVWALVRSNSRFLVKRANGVQLTSEPGNLTGLNSFKFSGLANKKAIDVSLKKDKTGKKTKVTLGLKRKNGRKVGKLYARLNINSAHGKSLAAGAAKVKALTAGAYYRADLAKFAVAKAQRLMHIQSVTKAAKKVERRARGKKAKAIAAAAAAKKANKTAKAAAKKEEEKKN